MIRALLFVPAAMWLLISAIFFAVGEFLSKKWAFSPSTKLALLVLLAYSLGTLAWLPALLHKNHLAIMGTAWLLLGTMATVLIGVFIFSEKLNSSGWIGLGLAILALILLTRGAG